MSTNKRKRESVEKQHYLTQMEIEDEYETNIYHTPLKKMKEHSLTLTEKVKVYLKRKDGRRIS